MMNQLQISRIRANQLQFSDVCVAIIFFLFPCSSGKKKVLFGQKKINVAIFKECELLGNQYLSHQEVLFLP